MKITNGTVQALEYAKADNKADLRFDDQLPGFGVRVYPSGKKSFFVSYRNTASVKKRLTLGNFGALTATQAREIAKSKLHEIHQGRDPASERRAKRNEVTFGGLAEQYLEHAAHHKRSIKSDRQRLRDHILPILGTRKLSDISLQQLQRLHSDIKGATSPSTANRCAALIKRMLNVSREWGLLDRSPAEHLKLFREPPPRDISLAVDECHRLIDACNADENVFARSLFLLAMFTGRRIGELTAAKWSDVNFDAGILTVPDTKAGERQHVVLNDAAIAILADIPRVAGNPYIIVGAKQGACMVFYRRAWDRIIARSGLRSFPPHGLRHNYASALVAGGVPLDTIRHLLGHKSSLTTLKYAHHRQDQLRAASREFSKIVPLERERLARERR